MMVSPVWIRTVSEAPDMKVRVVGPEEASGELPPPALDTADDRTLVEACLAGRGDAFEVIVERHRRPVYQLCYRFVGNRAAAEKAARDTHTAGLSRLATRANRAHSGKLGWRCESQFLPRAGQPQEAVAMTHLTEHEFTDLLDGTLPPTRMHHLDSCAVCRNQADALQDAMSRLSEAEMPEPSPLFWQHFSANVRNALRGYAPARSRWFAG